VQYRGALKTVFLLTLLGVFLITNSCGRAKASPSPVVTAAVMKTTRLWPRSSLPSNPWQLGQNPTSPMGYTVPASRTCWSRRISRNSRKSRSRIKSKRAGCSAESGKRPHSTMVTGKPLSAATPTDSDYASQIARVKKCIAAYPESPTPRISLAYHYLNYSWLARGSGPCQQCI